MSTMVEKVARALHRAHYERGRHLYEDLLWDRLGKFEQEMWMFSARAAIEAMIEPTPAMIEAAQYTADPYIESWPVMIQASLKEEGQ